MLLICLLPLALPAQRSLASVAQSATDYPLTQILDEITTAYTISIIYDAEQLAPIRIQPISVGQRSGEADLRAALRNTGLIYKKLNARTFVIKAGEAFSQIRSSTEKRSSPPPTPVIQLIDARGTVLDAETKEPLIGVNILVKDGTTGAVSDIDGSFYIQVEENSILVFSYLGYLSQEIVVDQADMGNILLASNAKQLDEVVVVGYGTQKRSDLTGALSSVSEKELKQLPNTGLDQALQGRAAGVYVTQNSGSPGGGVSIRIRGIGSTLTAEPLYVIDGVPVVNDNQGSSSNFAELDGGGQNPNALNTINPSDIQSIEILKDASATAIYGSRAANGVVLITTKRGAEGQSNISFETYYGIQELARKVPVLNLREYAEYYAEVGWDGIEEFERPELLGQGTDWQDAVFRQAGMQNYQLTVSGGNQQTKIRYVGRLSPTGGDRSRLRFRSLFQ